MQSLFLANCIRLVHILLVLFVIVVPFIKAAKWPLLLIHFMTILTLFAHWIFNEDTCFLTLVESTLRGVPLEYSFMYQIVSPIYKIQDESLKQCVMYITPLLGLVSFQRLVDAWPWDGTVDSWM